MPRGPRLDIPGALHHVMVRGIDRQNIFLSDADRNDLLVKRDVGPKSPLLELAQHRAAVTG